MVNCLQAQLSSPQQSSKKIAAAASIQTNLIHLLRHATAKPFHYFSHIHQRDGQADKIWTVLIVLADQVRQITAS